MAVITITVSDLDLGADTYHVQFAAVGDELANGQATAAYFVGYFLHEQVSEPEFLKAVGAYGKELIDNMSANGYDLMPMEKASVVLTLEDEDLATGRYKPSIEMLGGDPTGQRLPTTAQIIGTYMRNLISTADFQLACWKFADEFVKEHDGRQIINIEQAPDDAARAA